MPHGQSTLEYLALVLLAVLVLAAGGVAVAATGIAPAVAAQLLRALCIVRGGDCARADAPCVVASRSDARDVGLRVAILRLSGGRTVLRQTRSDGTELLTVISRAGAGVGLSAGIEAGVGDTTIGVTVGALVEGRIARGRAWLVRDELEADEILHRLQRPPTGGRAGLVRVIPPPAPPPDVTFGEQGLDARLDARLGGVGLSLEAEDLAGARADRATGERTFTIRRRNELLGDVGILAGVAAEDVARHDERYTLTVDATGRPLDLGILATRRIAVAARLPGPLRAVLGDQLPALRRGRVVEAERHLDLTEPISLAAAAAFVRALRSPRLQLGDAVAVSRALRARLDTAGSAQARVYELEARHAGARGGVSAGGGLGAESDHVTESLRLVAAAARGADGVWRERGDCVSRA